MRCSLVTAAILTCTLATAEDNLQKLNVVALDAAGQPVMGLQSSDFQLFKDGKPQRIAFSRFTGVKSRQAANPLPNEHSNRLTGQPATVVFIDLLNDRLLSAAVINNDLTRALKNFESSEGLYLYILTARGDLLPVQPVPRADTELTPAAEPWTRNIAPMLQEVLKNILGFRPVEDRDIAIRFDLTAKALRTLGSQMRLIPGRKNLVWVTHGVPLYVAGGSDQLDFDLTSPVRLLCEQLKRAQVVVYTVAQSMKGAGAAMDTASDQSLQEFAGLTGGRYFRSDAVGEAIQHAMTDSRANYQLAYYSASQVADGKYRKLRVTSPRKDVRLHAEEGSYSALPPIQPADQERNNLEIAAHSPFDSTGIGLRASLSPDPESKGKVDLHLRIDPSDLLLDQVQDRRTGKIAILFAVYSEKGFEQSSSPLPSEVSLTPEQYLKAASEGLAFRQTIALGAAVRRVRVFVVDRQLGTIGSVTVPVQR